MTLGIGKSQLTDAGSSVPAIVKHFRTTILSAQVATMFSAPIVLLPAKPGIIYQPIDVTCALELINVTIPYILPDPVNDTFGIYYASFSSFFQQIPSAGFFDSPTDIGILVPKDLITGGIPSFVNQDIIAAIFSNDMLAGNGDLIIDFYYVEQTI